VNVLLCVDAADTDAMVNPTTATKRTSKTIIFLLFIFNLSINFIKDILRFKSKKYLKYVFYYVVEYK
jgi:hypothetical protein